MPDLDPFALFHGHGRHGPQEAPLSPEEAAPARARAERILELYGAGVITDDTVDKATVIAACQGFLLRPTAAWAQLIDRFWLEENLEALDVTPGPPTGGDNAYLIDLKLPPGEQRSYCLRDRGVRWRCKRRWHSLTWLNLRNCSMNVWSTGGLWDIKTLDVDALAAVPNLRWRPEASFRHFKAPDPGALQYREECEATLLIRQRFAEAPGIWA